MGLKKNVLRFILFLAIILPFNVHAVRFNVDGSHNGGYPQAVAGLETQTQDVEALITLVPLAANFPYLHLIPDTRGPNGFNNYLDYSADIFISQAPENIRKLLRKMYFEGSSISESNDVWRTSHGNQLQRSVVSVTNGQPSIHVTTIEGTKDSPTLKKFLRLLAVVELINATIAHRHFGGRDYRLYHHVLDAVNQLSLGLLVEEILRNTTLGSLRSEVADFKGPVTIQATLEELLIPNQLQMRMAEVKRENYRLKDEAILNWVSLAEQKRNQNSKAVASLTAIDQMMDDLVTEEILERESTQDRFTLLREATARGYARMVRMLKKIRSPSVGDVGQLRCDFLFR